MYNLPRGVSERALVEWVWAHYGLDVEVMHVRPGYMSTTATVSGQAGRFVLKVVDIERAQDMRWGIDVCNVLRQADLPVPACLGARDDAHVVAQDGFVLSLWRFLEGDLYEPGQRAQLASAGAMLGRLHRATSGMALPEGRFWMPMGRTVATEVRRVASSIERDEVGDVRTLLRDFARRLGDLEGRDDEQLPRGVVHGDYRAQNLLFAGGDLVGILDLDAARPAPRLFDVAYALAFFQAVIADDPLSEDEMAIFLRAYHAICPLSAAEVAGLPAWLILALIKGMCLWVRIGYVDGANPRARDWLAAYADFFADGNAVGVRLSHHLVKSL